MIREPQVPKRKVSRSEPQTPKRKVSRSEHTSSEEKSESKRTHKFRREKWVEANHKFRREKWVEAKFRREKWVEANHEFRREKWVESLEVLTRSRFLKSRNPLDHATNTSFPRKKEKKKKLSVWTYHQSDCCSAARPNGPHVGGGDKPRGAWSASSASLTSLHVPYGWPISSRHGEPCPCDGWLSYVNEWN